jgi:hypothetical protein
MKKLSIIAIGIIALILIIPIFMKSSFKVERSLVIAKPASDIFPTVADFNTWKNWSVWALSDPEQKMTITGTPGQVGHTEEWDGKITGKGKQTVKSIIKDKEIVFDLEFTEPNAMVSTATILFESLDGGTKVTWLNEGNLDYPVGRYFGPFLDGMVGPDFEKGLSNLKSWVEKK